MEVTLLGIFTVVSPLHSKAASPMVVTPSPMVTDFRLLQSVKAFLPMDSTLLGIVTDVRPVHSLNAPSPMEVTPLPILMDFMPLQPPNALMPIDFTLSGMVMELRPLPAKALSPMDVTVYVFPAKTI